MKKKIQSHADLKAAIDTLVGYCWDDEERDYKAQPSQIHIFHTIRALDNWTRVED